jgi:glycine cleavage system H protein
MALEPFRGLIPEGLLYDPATDMWVRRDHDGVTVGATAFGIHLAGEIIGFTSKPRGAQVERGRGLGTVECAKTVLAVRAPVSYRIDRINEPLEENPSALNRDPYAAWMSRGAPDAWAAEAALLVDAAAYRTHVLCLDPGARFL